MTDQPATQHGNKSIVELVLEKKITVAQGVALAETWAGQELKQIPGGSSIAAFLEDLVGGSVTVADVGVEALAVALKTPVDTFLASKLPAPISTVAIQDANAAIDAQANAIIAFVQLQASNLKQNVAMGLGG